ncbi:MAG TPA: hypothetical protein V6D22_14975 [Candidatus Obscuribacterales bacterium]
MTELELILTSAGIGAICASLVTTAGTLIGQRFEREGRKRELLLSKSVEIALDQRAMYERLSKDRKMEILMPPDLDSITEAYRELDRIFHTGDVFPETRARMDSERDQMLEQGPPSVYS